MVNISSYKTLKYWGVFSASCVVMAGGYSLHSYKSEVQTQVLNLYCRADSVNVADAQQLAMALNIYSEGEQVALDYQFIDKGLIAGWAKLSGNLNRLDVANMDYKLHVNQAEVQLHGVSDWDLIDISTIINYAEETIEFGHSVVLDIGVVLMETDKGYAVLKFCPGNSVWVCEF
ncbi:hypothetical protein [Shewanella colwelliana]|uniref:hypothetical protein n=1 Tax=Shewanella colwelliana TaxID=23 RepID=UPI0022AF41AB|nr:hypothetical protein [Shewanella colwelliana]MCZ4339019.1 hypothetical protein [Shewanella colwelliana]